VKPCTYRTVRTQHALIFIILSGSWYQRYGHHYTDAFGAVQRFKCTACGKTFSTQTFHIDYYAKKVIDYEILIEHLVTSSGVLDLCRKLGVNAGSIENRFERLCRCVLAIHSALLSVLPLEEDVAADGLESFCFSQYYPNNINIIAGSRSEFIYSLGLSVLRRKGRMTESQRNKRESLEKRGKADPKAVERSFFHLFTDLTQRLARKAVTRKTLFTDEHPAYPRAFSRIPSFPLFFLHRTIPSKAPRPSSIPLPRQLR
jgi:transposase-like protein